MEEINVIQLSNSFDFIIIDNKNKIKCLNKIFWQSRGEVYTTKKGHNTFSLARFLTGKRFIDHIDRNGFNNLESNFREATQQQNRFNSSKRKNTSSRYKGVRFSKCHQKWQAQITFNYKYIHIGTFKSEIEAALAYDEKAKELFNNFAALNFPVSS